jgi:hypothetical protein
MTQLIRNAQMGKFIKTERWLVVRVSGRRVRGKRGRLQGVSSWSDKNVLQFDCGNGCTTLTILRNIDLYMYLGELHVCIFYES